MIDLIRWEPNCLGAGYSGYAGTYRDPLFAILDRGDDAPLELITSLPGYPRGQFVARADTPGPLKARAEELLREFAVSIGAVFPVPAEPLTVGAARCDSAVPYVEDGEPDPDGGCVQCDEPSRYAVMRSDRDPSYDAALDRAPAEACEAHLGETVFGLMDGDDKMTVIVQARWDA